MDFARKQLEKYGWTEGRGLGKKEDGIQEAIKPKLKFDNAGIGHNPGEEFTNDWWNNVYNNALNNIQVETNEDEVTINLKSKNSINITTSKYISNKQNTSQYGHFIKVEKLTPKGVVNVKKDNVSDSESILPKLTALSDDELFAACGGRTAHKAARHGLNLSGKLARIEKQEKILMKKLQKVTLDHEENNIKKKIKKLSNNKELKLKQLDDNIVDDYDSRSSTGSVTPKKKSKKKKKSVSFKDVVTEYTTHESSSPLTSKQSVITTIEETTINDNTSNMSPSFEKVRRNLLDAQIKIEPYVKKHKKKKDKKNTATARFLSNMHNDVDNLETEDFKLNCKKRKLYESMKYNSGRKKKKTVKEESISNIADTLDQMCKIEDNDKY